MRLFLLPSWYPHRCYPWEGAFLQQQARAIAELRPDWKVAISLWGQGVGFLSTAHLRHSPRCAIEALTSRPFERDVLGNLVEIHTPSLWWPERVLGGNKEGLLAANRRNLDRARARFGGIDVLHAHVSYPGGWLAMRLSEATGIPYVITEHMGPFPLPVYARADGSLAPWLREPLARADARIAVSPMLARSIAAHGIPEPEVIPNLVDERLYPLDPTRGGSEPFTFFTLALMDPSKGIGDLLEAIPGFLATLAPEARSRVRFRLGGGGPSLETFRRRAAELGLGAHVEFLGQLPAERTREEFARGDCFVLPSRHESFGIVYVEAAACGRPVIATRCGGPEGIVTKESGVLVDVADAPQLSQALHFMFERARGYDAAAIRAQCLARFGRAAVVDRLESVYRRIARAPEGRAVTAAPAGAV